MARSSQRAAARQATVVPTIASPAVPATFPIVSLNDGGASQQQQEPTNLQLWKMLKVVIDNQIAMGQALDKIHHRIHAIEYKADHDRKGPDGLLYRILLKACAASSRCCSTSRRIEGIARLVAVLGGEKPPTVRARVG